MITRKIFKQIPGLRRRKTQHDSSPSPPRSLYNHSEPGHSRRDDSPWNHTQDQNQSDDSGRERAELMFRKRPRRNSPRPLPSSSIVKRARKMIRHGMNHGDPDDSPDDSDESDDDDNLPPQDPPPEYHDAYGDLQNTILGGFRQLSRERDEDRRNNKRCTKIKRPFTPSSAHLWIVLMENSFALHHIYDDRIQFEIALDNLTERHLVRLKPYLRGQSWYSLKDGINTVYSEHSKSEKISAAHTLQMESGPQDLMNQILDTLEISLTDLSEENAEYVKHLYMNKLPSDISSQLILLPETLTIKEIARYAEKIHKNKLKDDREALGLHDKLGKLNINNQLNDLGKAMASTMKAVKDLAEDQAKIRIDFNDKNNKYHKKKIESVGFTNLQGPDNKFQSTNTPNQIPPYPTNNNHGGYTQNRPPQYPTNNNHIRNNQNQSTPYFRNNDHLGQNNNYYNASRQSDFRSQRNNNYNAPYSSDRRYNAPYQRYNRQNNYQPNFNNRYTPNSGFNGPRNGNPNLTPRYNRSNPQQFKDWQKQASPTASWCPQHKTYGPYCWQTSCDGNNPSCNFKKTFLG